MLREKKREKFSLSRRASERDRESVCTSAGLHVGPFNERLVIATAVPLHSVAGLDERCRKVESHHLVRCVDRLGLGVRV
jgi:hypothetical protein